MGLSPEIKALLWEIFVEKRPSTPANIARGNQWRKAGEYERQESFDCICGGWYLIRKDENASISAHFAGCLRIAPVRVKDKLKEGGSIGIWEVLATYLWGFFCGWLATYLYLMNRAS